MAFGENFSATEKKMFMPFISCMFEAIPENFVVWSYTYMQINVLLVCSDISLWKSNVLGAGRSSPFCKDCVVYYLNGFTCALILYIFHILLQTLLGTGILNTCKLPRSI